MSDPLGAGFWVSVEIWGEGKTSFSHLLDIFVMGFHHLIVEFQGFHLFFPNSNWSEDSFFVKILLKYNWFTKLLICAVQQWLNYTYINSYSFPLWSCHKMLRIYLLNAGKQCCIALQKSLLNLYFHQKCASNPIPKNPPQHCILSVITSL